MVNDLQLVVQDVARALGLNVDQVVAVIDLVRLYKRRANTKKGGI